MSDEAKVGLVQESSATEDTHPGWGNIVEDSADSVLVVQTAHGPRKLACYSFGARLLNMPESPHGMYLPAVVRRGRWEPLVGWRTAFRWIREDAEGDAMSREEWIARFGTEPRY